MNVSDSAKMAMPDSHRYSWNCYLKYVKDTFLGWKVFNSDNSYIFSCSRNAQDTSVEKP